MVTIQVRGKSAVVDKLHWSSDDPRVENVLNNLFTDAMGVDPHPDLTVATLAIQALGGSITQADPVTPSKGDLIY